jgi:hypothetical protein
MAPCRQCVAVTPPLPLLGHHLSEEKYHFTRHLELACTAVLLHPPLLVATQLTVASHHRAAFVPSNQAKGSAMMSCICTEC